MIALDARLLKALAASVMLALLMTLFGCAAAPVTPAPSSLPMPAPAAPATEGSIYANGGGLALFEDQKARRVGDTLTIILVERTNAKKNASTSTSKDSETDIGNPTLFGRPLSVNGTPVGAFGLESSRKFAGKGDSSQSNQLDGSVSVIVSQVLPNGSLVVSGSKHLQINQGKETVSIEGIVRPADIRPDNTVTSDRVANANISYAGAGAVADSNAAGWLTRFFNSGWFPF